MAEGTELLRSRNGRIFSDVERDVLNDVSNSAEATEALSAIPDDFSFLRPTDPWLTDRQVVRCIIIVVFLERCHSCYSTIFMLL